MDFESIIYFLRACELQSLTKAAQELYTTQPTISRRILALEDELGVELLKRKSTGIEVTAAGKLFYDKQKKLMLDQKSLLERMKYFRSGQSGILQIGVEIPGFYKPLFRSAQIMKKNYPDVDVHFYFTNKEQLFNYYTCGKIDIACTLRHHLPNDSESVIITAKQNYPTLMIPEGHRLWGKTDIKLTDLKNELFVIMRRQNNTAEEVYHYAEKQGVFFRNAVICESPVDRAFQAALRGYLTLSSTCYCEEWYGVEEAFQSVPLTEININSADMCVMYRPTNSIAERFANLICEYFEEQEYDL